METEEESTEEGLTDYKLEIQKKDVIIAKQKEKLEEYARRVMELINEKNELKKSLENKKSLAPSNDSLLTSTPSEELLSPKPTEELLNPIPAEELLTTSPSDNETLVDYKSEARKRDAIIKDLNEKLNENVKKTMSVINEKNEIKRQLEAIQQKSQTLEDKESKIEGIWKRKLLEAERKVRAIEKILEQKNTEISNLQSRYIAELTEKDRIIKELKEESKGKPEEISEEKSEENE